MSLSEIQRLPLIRRHQSVLAAIVARITPSIQRAWMGLGSYDEADIPTFTRQTATALTASKTATVAAAVGFYALLSGARPPAVAATEIAAVPQMSDPFISVWQALAAGRPNEEALAAGHSRLEAVATDFVNTTARQTGDIFTARAGLRTNGWERVPNLGACDWCRQVAGETYRTANSADFGHSRCACSAVPRF